MTASEPIKVRTSLVGRGKLSMHNIRLANPDDEFAKAIGVITAKRKKTEDDRKEIAHLEFLGGLYTDAGKVAIPKMNVRRAFMEAAKATRRGRDIVRAVTPLDGDELAAPLVFDGQGKTPDELWTAGTYSEITMVGVKGGRVARCRPTFRNWALSIDWLLLPNFLDFDQFAAIVQDAGLIEGLGDNRTGGYGRFDAQVTKL